MSVKLPKSSFPVNHSAEDFKAFGPPATEDGQFENCKIADMGSFSQDEKDSNKYYCAMIVQSIKTSIWYCYFEWGRVGAKNPQFQMVECASEIQAQKEFASQCHEKNDKRGEWTVLPGTDIRTLTSKKGKDVYLVRQLTARSTGLPDAKTIKAIDQNILPVKKAATKNKKNQVDFQTAKLIKDLTGGTINYTRSVMADNSLPSKSSIDQARQILTEAEKRVAHVGHDLKDQIVDKDLRIYSAELYKRIPKIKVVGTPDEVWILSSENIISWRQDLDAFESSLNAQYNEVEEESQEDVLGNLPITMQWVDPKTKLGEFLYYWWPLATANKHGSIGQMKLKNIWQLERNGDGQKFATEQNKIYSELIGTKIEERPLFQPSERLDVPKDKRGIYQDSNTSLLFHGTRSVNVTGILQTGLRSPKELTGVSIAGAMFGVATGYWADDWKKSAGYTSMRNSYWSKGAGRIANREAFMFAGDIACGQPFVAPGPQGFKGPPNGCHCILGMGRNHGKVDTRGNLVYSGVENNEWVIFRQSQINLKYLAEFTV